MSRTIDLTLGALAIVRDILRAHLPVDARVWVFGSRATGTARRYSDLDLALEGDRPLDWMLLADITTALSESDLPFKVDVLDLLAIEPSFRQLIEADRVVLPIRGN
jgi:predicted nucleotidyltransferase